MSDNTGCLSTLGGSTNYSLVIACKGICGFLTCLAILVTAIIAICFAVTNTDTNKAMTYGYQTHLVASYATDLENPAQIFPNAVCVGPEEFQDLVVPGAELDLGNGKAGNDVAYGIWYPYIAVTIGAVIYAFGLCAEWWVGRRGGKDSYVVRNYEANGNDIRWAYTTLTDVALFAALAAYAGAVNVYVVSALAIFAFAWDVLFYTSSFVNDRRITAEQKKQSETGKFERPRVWWFFCYGLLIAIPVFVGFFIIYCYMVSVDNVTTFVPTTFWLMSVIAAAWYLLYVIIAVCLCELLRVSSFGGGAVAKEGCFIFMHGLFVWLIILWAGIEFAVNAGAASTPMM